MRVHDQSPRMEQPSNNHLPLPMVAPAWPVARGQREGTCDPEGDEARKDSFSEEEEDAHQEEKVCQWKGFHRAAVARDCIVKLCPLADSGEPRPGLLKISISCFLVPPLPGCWICY